MPSEPGYHNRQAVIVPKICSLFYFLEPSTYDELTPKIEYWIEYAFAEHSTTIEELVEEIASVAWYSRDHRHASIARFLKEFRDAPHRSEQAKSFVDELCPHVLRWFAAASAENLIIHTVTPSRNRVCKVARSGGKGFICAASFVGYLIECGLLNRELVRRHLIKPLIAHHYGDSDEERSVRAMAIYRLFTAARNTLLQGLLKPEDVRACFKELDIKISLEGIPGPDAAKLNELREFHAMWLKRKEEERRDAETGGEDTVVAEVSAEVGTPVAIVSKNLPAATIDTDIPSSILRNIASPSILQDAESSSETFVDIPATGLASPTFSISTISDLTPTELGEDIEHSEEQTTTRHDTFYFEDGNVEIVCGHTVFRVHSTIISFSSSKLRDMVSPPTLLNAQMPEGRPRITVSDSAEDFSVLLKMIYTPGFPARNKVPEFSGFASLLRMATKYDFSDVREHLVEDLKGAYPTRWEDFENAKVLGEDVFGSPKPHPNAVLNLFLEQSIKFALPFAAYRASLGGFPSLVSNKPGTVLPRPTLTSITYGTGAIKRTMAIAAHTICTVRLGVCVEKVCALKAGIDVLKIFDVMLPRIEGDALSPLSFGTVVCTDCAKRLEKIHLSFRKRFAWTLLPKLLGFRESWEGV